MASELSPDEKMRLLAEIRGYNLEKAGTARDPKTGFVYPVFPDATLSPDAEKAVRRAVHDSYTKVIELMLKQHGQVSICTHEIYAFDQPNGDVVFEWRNLSKEQKDTLTAFSTPGAGDFTDQSLLFAAKIKTIQKAFQECPVPDFYLPLNIVYHDLKSSHKNFLVLNKATNTVLWVEPLIEEDRERALSYIQARKATFHRLVETIGLKASVMVVPTAGLCPQVVTRDFNCMFWGLLTILLYTLNPGIVRQDDLYDRFYSATEMRTADGKINGEKLGHYIENFKATFGPKKAGRRTTRRNRR